MTDSNLPPDVQSKLEHLSKLEALLPITRQDIRGMLTPMLLVADRLAMHTDERVVRAADTLILSITRIDAQLAATEKVD